MMKKVLMYVKRILVILGTILAVILTTLTTVICLSEEWMFNTWNNLSMDELLYHLTTPLEGTNEELIREYLNVCITPAVLVLLSIALLFLAWHRKKRYFLLMIGGIAVSLIVSVKTIHGAWNKLDMGSYVESQGTYSTFIEDYYVDPANVSISFPEKKRNLIYIFLESMERTYADIENGGAFEENVIPELTQIAQENEDFSGESTKLNGGYSMPGATWTIAGMFSQTSGIPLKISIDNNNMDTQDSFFPSVITLGDILEEAGYSQTLMIGSNATFGGRRLYFTEHGNYDMRDYNYAIEKNLIPEGYYVWWGHEDQRLFKFAKKRLLELAESEEPFNMTLLTVDTHFENGYVCDICQDSFGDDQYSNVMACSSRQVNELIEWIQCQDFYEDTTIVLAGDHPTMDKDFCEDIDDEYIRKVYTAYINPVAELEMNRERNYTTFDHFPTTLAALGVEIEGDRLGLGTNLFSRTQTLTERFGIDVVEKEIEKKSKMMEELADLDKNTQELKIREGRVPLADVTAGEYEYATGTIPVSVTNIRNVKEGVEIVNMAVWTTEDQSDLQWIQMNKQEDESFYGDISIPNFGYKEGEYKIHIYVIDGTGEQYVVGSTIGVVN